MATLAQAITSVLPPDDRMRIGVVTSVVPPVVLVQGSEVPASSLSPYTPIIGDTVAMIRQDAVWVMLGRTTDQLTGMSPQSQAGAVSASVVAATSFSTTVTFQIPWPTGLIPVVVTNIDSGSGTTAGWISRAINISETAFTLFASGGSTTFSNIEIQWLAREKTQ